jgi:hypothetical protein
MTRTHGAERSRTAKWGGQGGAGGWEARHMRAVNEGGQPRQEARRQLGATAGKGANSPGPASSRRPARHTGQSDAKLPRTGPAAGCAAAPQLHRLRGKNGVGRSQAGTHTQPTAIFLRAAAGVGRASRRASAGRVAWGRHAALHSAAPRAKLPRRRAAECGAGEVSDVEGGAGQPWAAGRRTTKGACVGGAGQTTGRGVGFGVEVVWGRRDGRLPPCAAVTRADGLWADWNG